MTGNPLAEPATPTIPLFAWREAGWTGLAGLIVVGFCGLLLLHDPQWFWADDYQTYQLANYCDVARAWHAGELPLLSPYTWNGGALAGEYQNGVFSIVLTGLTVAIFSVGLSLTAAATTLSLFHLAVLAAGTFRLGRRRGLPVDLALLTALVATLSGWIMIWGAKAWFPALASFAWLPWFWWALDRSLDQQASVARFLPAGFFLYLIITAGWPFTVLMSALLCAWFIRRYRAEHKCWLPTWPIVAAGFVGLGLSAPAWLMLMEYSAETARGQTPPLIFVATWKVPIPALAGLVFPGLCTTWNVFGENKDHMCLEMTGGLIPIAILAAVFTSCGRAAFRKLGWEIGLGLMVLILALLPSPGNFRWSYRWLPMFSLILPLVAAHALAEARATITFRRCVPGVFATVLITPIWLFALWTGTDPTTTTLTLGATLVASCLLWAGIDFRFPMDSIQRKCIPSVVALASSWLVYAWTGPFLEVPVWNAATVERSLPLDARNRYFGMHIWSDIVEVRAGQIVTSSIASKDYPIPGNFNVYSEHEFINGYSPMKPRGLHSLFSFGVHGEFDIGDSEHPALRVVVAESGPGDLLALMGVNGLVVSNRLDFVVPTLEAKGWKKHATLPGSIILHRTTPAGRRVIAVEKAVRINERTRALEMVKNREIDSGWVVYEPKGEETSAESPPAQEFAAAQIDIERDSRNEVKVRVTNRSDRETLVVFARPWFPGYIATFNGQPVEVDQFNLIMPAVRLPRGESGRVVLEYRPASFVNGCRLAVGTLAIGLLACVYVGCRRWKFNSGLHG